MSQHVTTFRRIFSRGRKVGGAQLVLTLQANHRSTVINCGALSISAVKSQCLQPAKRCPTPAGHQGTTCTCGGGCKGPSFSPAARDSSKVLYAGETDLDVPWCSLMFLDLRFAGVWAVVQRLPAVMPKLYVSCTLCPHSSRACRTCAVIGAIVHLFGAHSTTWTQFSAVVFSQDADHLRHLFHDFSETCQRHLCKSQPSGQSEH